MDIDGSPSGLVLSVVTDARAQSALEGRQIHGAAKSSGPSAFAPLLVECSVPDALLLVECSVPDALWAYAVRRRGVTAMLGRWTT
jgi:hypothetical protein